MDSNEQRKRYFGMTMGQLGILVFFGIMDTLVICFGIYLLVNSQISRNSVVAEGIPTVEPSHNNLPAVTLTELQTSVPFPGWNLFQTSKFEIWLPPYFIGGDFESNKERIIAEIRNLGSDYEPIAAGLEQNQTTFVLYAVDSTHGQSGIMTNVNITENQVSSLIPLESYMNSSVRQLPPEWTVIDIQTYRHGDYDAGKIMTEYTLYNMVGRQIIYLIRKGGTIWIITFTTAASEFDSRLPTFNMCEYTFNIL